MPLKQLFANSTMVSGYIVFLLHPVYLLNLIIKIKSRAFWTSCFRFPKIKVYLIFLTTRNLPLFLTKPPFFLPWTTPVLHGTRTPLVLPGITTVLPGTTPVTCPTCDQVPPLFYLGPPLSYMGPGPPLFYLGPPLSYLGPGPTISGQMERVQNSEIVPYIRFMCSKNPIAKI